jgi:hypothetical protein
MPSCLGTDRTAFFSAQFQEKLAVATAAVITYHQPATMYQRQTYCLWKKVYQGVGK